MMKNNRLILKIAGVFAIILMMISCEPQLLDKPDIGNAPDADDISFTMTPGKNEFHVIFTNTSKVTGIPSWDFGNGIKGTANQVEVKYSLEGTYPVTLTLVTRGGTGSVTQDHVQTVTDFSIFTEPVYVNLSGGSGMPAGKTWVLDAESQGHLGVGPVGGNGLEWWSAAPFAKAGTSAYDDEITFKIDQFAVTYNNNGKSYVKAYRKDDPNYSNPVENDTDFDVNYTTPVSGTWDIVEKSDGYYLILTSPKPIFPNFDVGAKNNEYKIVRVEENLLELTCLSSYEDWTNWHFQLVPKGFERPKITFDMDATEGTDNNVSMSVSNYSIPAGQSVTNIAWDFGDGSPVYTGGKDEVVNHVYMRRGTYNIVAKLNTSIGIITSTKSITLVNDNSAYVPFLLDLMVMYNDFSEIQEFPVGGQDCAVSIVDNPSKVYPNKSTKVAFYSKTAQQWANAYMELRPGYRFDLRQQHTFKIMVYGKAGDVVLLKLENTDKGGDAWQTGTELTYTIMETNKWEEAEFDFDGADVQPGAEGWKWWPDPVSYDVVADPYYNNNFYNIVRIMLNPGTGDGTHEFYFDNLAGPHVEGIMK